MKASSRICILAQERLKPRRTQTKLEKIEKRYIHREVCVTGWKAETLQLSAKVFMWRDEAKEGRGWPWVLEERAPVLSDKGCPGWTECWCWSRSSHGSWLTCPWDRCHTPQRKGTLWWCSYTHSEASCHWFLHPRSAIKRSGNNTSQGLTMSDQKSPSHKNETALKAVA